MKKHNWWELLVNKFIIRFNLTKNDKRPSKDKASSLHTVEAVVLPDKETIMEDEFSGYTKTKIKVKEVLKGTLTSGKIIEIYEPYYIGYYGGKECIIVHESYEPLIVGKTYTFLLTKDEVYKIMNEAQEQVPACTNYYKSLYHKVS